MATLTDLRKEVVDALNDGGIVAVHFVEEVNNPPIALVVPDSPYLDQVETAFGEWNVNLSVVLAAASGTNETVTFDVDELIEKAIGILKEAGWDVTEVSQPGTVTVNGSPFVGAVLTLQTQTRF